MNAFLFFILDILKVPAVFSWTYCIGRFGCAKESITGHY